MLAALLALVAAGLAAYALAASGGSGGSPAGAAGSEFRTSETRIERRSLESQTQVSATLGYADPSTIVVPPGTAPASVQQAAQQVTTARTQLATATTTSGADEQTLRQAQAALAASRAREAVDCRGGSAAGDPPSSPAASGGSSASTPCAADEQTVSAGEQGLLGDRQKVAADRAQVTAARGALAAAQAALASAQASGSLVDQSSAYTSLPATGRIVRRGEGLYAISGRPVILLYGPVAAWRAFTAGMPPGADVRELNANLDALGYGHGLAGDSFTAATAEAIGAFEAAHALARTGQLLLGSVVFEPGPVRVTGVTPALGAAVQPGPVLSVTSTRRVVSIALDAGQQSEVAVGDPVTITLPDDSTTPGTVTYVGTVATTPSSDQGGGQGQSSPTIEVDVTPARPAATGRIDQAPVDVSITTASVRNVLVVPVNALLALAGGGYALEEVAAGGTHRLVAVDLGLFDDREGLVQVTGSGLAAGQRVVVPGA